MNRNYIRDPDYDGPGPTPDEQLRTDGKRSLMRLLLLEAVVVVGLVVALVSNAYAQTSPDDFKFCSETACVQIIITPIDSTPVCPAKPADQTRPGVCPTGTTGNWTQTLTHASVASPICWQAGAWLPESPPAGACVSTPPVNRPPTLTGTPPSSVVAGQAYAFTPVAADEDGDTLAFTIANRPTWATFSAATGALTGTPTAAGISSSIVITVSDGKASAATNAFSITVTAPAPLATPVGLSATVAPHPTNVDRYNATLTWTPVPGAASYDIERCTGATCTGFAKIDGSTPATYVNQNLPAGLAYRYRVRAQAPPLPRSQPSAAVVVRTPTTPPPPPPGGTASLTITPQMTNTDGTPLTNLAGFRVLYGTAPGSLTRTVQVPATGVTTYVVQSLAAGTWYFAVTAYASNGFESGPSNVVSRVVP